MSNAAYNPPHYGYGSATPPQPTPPQPMPMPSNDEPDSPAPAVASYDVDPSAGHAPPLVVTPSATAMPVSPAGSVTFEKAEPSAEPSAEPYAEAQPDAEPATPTESAPEPVTPASSGRVAVQVVDRLRSTAERGTTTVPTHVIEKIATLAVREVPGVHEFATAEAAEGEPPLSIDLDGKAAAIEMHLVIEYGFAVHSVTEKVRTKVISALENLFSLDVTAVDIVIDDIHLEETEPTAE